MSEEQKPCLRTGGRQSYDAGSSSHLCNKACLRKCSPTSLLTPSRAPIPAHIVLNSRQKTKNSRKKNTKQEKDRNLKREEKTQVNSQK